MQAGNNVVPAIKVNASVETRSGQAASGLRGRGEGALWEAEQFVCWARPPGGGGEAQAPEKLEQWSTEVSEPLPPSEELTGAGAPRALRLRRSCTLSVSAGLQAPFL